MAFEMKMPQLGLTMTEGVITRWLKKEGDAVAKGDILYEVETDKLTNEVESDAEGILRKILQPEGAEVPVQGVVAIVAAADEVLEVPVPAQAVTPAALPVGAPAPQREGGAASAMGRAGRVKASPMAKKLASAAGLDLSAIIGTGPGGRIVKRDVLTAGERGISPAIPTAAAFSDPAPAEEAAPVQVQAPTQMQSPAPTQAPAPQPQPAGESVAEAAPAQSAAPASSGTRRERLSAMRRAISRNMAASWTTAPAVTYTMRADAGELTALKQRLLEEDGLKVSYTDILAKMAAVVLGEFPYVNAAIDGEDVVYHDGVNLGIAVALEDGLVVPVVRDAHRKGIGAISGEIRELAKAAREGGLAPEQLSGGTFTITNLGMFGMEGFTPIINLPECAILGVNAIVKTAVEVDGEMVMRPMLTLNLTADHRLVDGAVGARFLRRLCDVVEKPWRLVV